MNMEEYKKYVNNTCEKNENKLDVNSEEFDLFIKLVRTFNQVCIERNNLEQALNEIEEILKESSEMSNEELVTKLNNLIQESISYNKNQSGPKLAKTRNPKK